MPKISLIVGVYKNIPYLELVLVSIRKQRYRDFEIIIAEDDNSVQTVTFLEAQRTLDSLVIKHVFQEHNGWGKNKILNKALRVATGEFILFIDGDSILHPGFIKYYAEHSRVGRGLFGRRVDLDKVTSDRLCATKKVHYLKWYRLIFTQPTRVKGALYWPFPTSFRKAGCNGHSMCFSRQELEK